MRLQEAGSILERREARRRPNASVPAHPADGGDRPRCSQGAAQHERPKTASSLALVVHATILRMRLVSLGDLILDVVVGLEGDLVVGDDRTAETHVGAGGQGANVAAWAAALGAEARYVGKRGADAAGELAMRELAAHGVEVAGPVGGRGGVVVSIAADGERSMASDRGSATELAPADLEASWFDCDVLHVSGYALLVEPSASAAERGVALARTAGASISVDLSSWSLVDERFRERVQRIAPDVVFATEREQAAFGSFDVAWVIKRGPLGVRVDGVDHPTLASDVARPDRRR